MKADFDVPQEDLRLLRVGAPAEITSEAAPGRILNGKITEISRFATGGEGVSATGRVIVEAPKSDGGFAVGSSVTTKIEIRREDAPDEAAAPSSPLSKSRAPE